MGTKKKWLGMLLCIATLSLAACDELGRPNATPTATVPARAATQTAVSASSVPTAPTTPGKPTTAARPTAPSGWTGKVTYVVSGGIAGIKRTLLVGPSGQARLTEGSKNSGPVRLTPEKLALLKQKLDATDFFNLKDNYGTGTVSDDFILTLSLTQDGVTKTVAVEQIGGQGVTPQGLLDFIGELDKLQGEIEVKATPMGTPVP